MSAVELIKQVAALPQQERTLFDQLFRAMLDRRDELSSATQWPDFAEHLQAVYGEKIAPDSGAIIDEGRGER